MLKYLPKSVSEGFQFCIIKADKVAIKKKKYGNTNHMASVSIEE